uniref:Uncharacterized protein n=1 Tax=Arundo donax TaxID=35708 RepID=A0A0A9DTZ5_ARUDO
MTCFCEVLALLFFCCKIVLSLTQCYCEFWMLKMQKAGKVCDIRMSKHCDQRVKWPHICLQC